ETPAYHHYRLIRLNTLYTTAVRSSDWPEIVGRAVVTRALTVPNHGLRQLLRAAIRPRCRRRHGSLSMKRSSVPQSAGFASAMSNESRGTYAMSFSMPPLPIPSALASPCTTYVNGVPDAPAYRSEICIR